MRVMKRPFTEVRQNIRDVARLSMHPKTPCSRHMYAKLTLACANLLPSLTFAASPGDKPSNPSGKSSLRSGGGPPVPGSRALLNEMHGVPMCTTSIKPWATAIRRSLRFEAINKSKPWMMSAPITQNPLRRMALAQCPEPLNNSNATHGRCWLPRSTCAKS